MEADHKANFINACNYADLWEFLSYLDNGEDIEKAFLLWQDCGSPSSLTDDKGLLTQLVRMADGMDYDKELVEKCKKQYKSRSII